MSLKNKILQLYELNIKIFEFIIHNNFKGILKSIANFDFYNLNEYQFVN